MYGLPINRIQSRWAGLRRFAPDGKFFVGADLNLSENLWFLGQGGCGFQCAPAMTELVCTAASSTNLAAGGAGPVSHLRCWINDAQPLKKIALTLRCGGASLFTGYRALE